MNIAKANAKENLGAFICLSIAKAKASSLQIFICNRFRADGNSRGFRAVQEGSRVRKRGLLEKGSFQKSPFSRDSRDFSEPPDCGK